MTKFIEEKIVKLADSLYIRGEIVAGRSGNDVYIGNRVISLPSKDEAENLMDALDELISDLTDSTDDDC
jgi:hypothetical protein